ncbi:MAG: MBL fold metallo-hydrolase [Acidimicrobiales bacterium]
MGSAVTLRFVGSGDAFGSGGRLQTCMLLEGAGAPLMIDCGASSLIGLRRDRIDPHHIGHVVISHLHGDHFSGLAFLMLECRIAGRTEPLVVAGPPGIEARLATTTEALYPGSSSVPSRFEVTYREIEPGGTTTVGPAVVAAFEAEHRSGAPSLTLRIEYGDRIVVYSGDTAFTDRLLTAVDGADLFVCESSAYDRPIPFHMDWATLSANRDRLGCRRLVVTHMGPEMLARVADLAVESASDGLVLTV